MTSTLEKMIAAAEAQGFWANHDEEKIYLRSPKGPMGRILSIDVGSIIPGEAAARLKGFAAKYDVDAAVRDWMEKANLVKLEPGTRHTTIKAALSELYGDVCALAATWEELAKEYSVFEGVYFDDEVFFEKDHINLAFLLATDDVYEACFDCANVKDVIKQESLKSIDAIWKETDTTFNLTADFYSTDDIRLHLISYSDTIEELKWKDFPVPLTDAEKKALVREVNKQFVHDGGLEGLMRQMREMSEEREQ